MIDPRRKGVDCVRYAAMESVHVFLLSYSHSAPTFPAHVPIAYAKWVHFHIFNVSNLSCNLQESQGLMTSVTPCKRGKYLGDT